MMNKKYIKGGSTMSKKTLLAVTLILMVSVVFTSTLVFAQQHKLKFALTYNTQDDHYFAAERFAELVKKGTNGRITMDIYPGGQLGNAPQSLKLLSVGEIDLFEYGIVGLQAYDKRIMTMNIPFLVDNLPHMARILDSPLFQDVFESIAKKHNIRTLSWNGNKRFKNIFTKNKPVFTPDDVQGLKVRIPPIIMVKEIWKALGANPVSTSWAESYQALAQGLAEAVEAPLPVSFRVKHQEICKYYTFIKYQASPDGIYINEKTYAKLSPDDRRVLSEAAKKAMDYFSELQEKSLETDKVKMMEDYGVSIIYVSNKPWKKLIKESKLVERLEEAGTWEKGFAQKVYKIAEQTK